MLLRKAHRFRKGILLSAALVGACTLSLVVGEPAHAQNQAQIIQANNEALNLMVAEEYEAAAAILEPIVRESENRRGTEDAITLSAINTLATIYFSSGLLDAAEPLYLRLAEAYERLSRAGDPSAVSLMSSYAMVAMNYTRAGKHGEAEPWVRKQAGVYRRMFGADDPNTLAGNANIAINLADQGRLEEAEVAYLATIADMTRVVGADDFRTVSYTLLYANMLATSDRYAEAEPIYARVANAYERLHGRRSTEVASVLSMIASVKVQSGDWGEAEALFDRAIAISRRAPKASGGGRNGVLALSYRAMRSDLYAKQGRVDEAEEELKSVIATIEGEYGRKSAPLIHPLSVLAGVYLDQERYREAEQLYVRAIDIAQQHHLSWGAFTASLKSNLAAVRIAQGRPAEAETAMRTLLDTTQSVLGEEAPETVAAARNLVVSLQEQERSEEADAVLERIPAARFGTGPSAGEVQSPAQAPCMIVTDIVIRGGEEVRMESQMCRVPPSPRWTRA